MGMKFLIFRSIVPMIRFDSAEWKKNYFDAYKGHATMLTSNPFTEQMKHSIQVEFVSREPTLRGVTEGEGEFENEQSTRSRFPLSAAFSWKIFSIAQVTSMEMAT